MAPADGLRVSVACADRTKAEPKERQQGKRRPTGGLTGAMDRFVSNYTLRLDAKGRVSIPAPFRAVLARDGFEGLYCYPALDQPALDAGGHALLQEIEELITRYQPYSDARDGLSTALYGTSETLKLDGEGRVTLTEPLKAHAGIV